MLQELGIGIQLPRVFHPINKSQADVWVRITRIQPDRSLEHLASLDKRARGKAEELFNSAQIIIISFQITSSLTNRSPLIEYRELKTQSGYKTTNYVVLHLKDTR